MITIYETRFIGATDHKGSRIKVTNTRTTASRQVPWEWSINGGHDQHQHAVRQCAAGDILSVEYGGETRLGYLWVVTQ
jgi:hypothetical protein